LRRILTSSTFNVLFKPAWELIQIGDLIDQPGIFRGPGGVGPLVDQLFDLLRAQRFPAPGLGDPLDHALFEIIASTVSSCLRNCGLMLERVNGSAGPLELAHL